MEVIKGLALKGLTVCATIHSPSPTAFALFDRLLLLLDGQIAYFGARGMFVKRSLLHAPQQGSATPRMQMTSLLPLQACCVETSQKTVMT